MPRIVRSSLIQAANAAPPDAPLAKVKQAMMDKHETYIAQATAGQSSLRGLKGSFRYMYFLATTYCGSSSPSRFGGNRG
jgi:hypothetical protein